MSYHLSGQGIYEHRNELSIWLDVAIDKDCGLKQILDIFMRSKEGDFCVWYSVPERWDVVVLQHGTENYEIQYVERDESSDSPRYGLMRIRCDKQ